MQRAVDQISRAQAFDMRVPNHQFELRTLETIQLTPEIGKAAKRGGQTTPFCGPCLVAETQTFRLSRLRRQHPDGIIHDDNLRSLSLTTLKRGQEPGNDGPPSSIYSTHPDPWISWTPGTRDEISPTPGTVVDRLFVEGFCVMQEETIKLKNRSRFKDDAKTYDASNFKV